MALEIDKEKIKMVILDAIDELFDGGGSTKEVCIFQCDHVNVVINASLNSVDDNRVDMMHKRNCITGSAIS